jgi:hypothetical protein
MYDNENRPMYTLQTNNPSECKMWVRDIKVKERIVLKQSTDDTNPLASSTESIASTESAEAKDES